MTRACSLLAAPFLCLVMAATALAQANPLEVIPDDAFGFVVIRDLSDANAKVNKLTEKMQLPLPNVLEMVKQMAGVDQGVDEKGGIAIAALPTDESPFGVFGFVPVTDYQKFIASLTPEDAEAKITKVTLFGQPMLVGRKGNFAVVAMSVEHEALLEQVLASERSVVQTIEPLKAWMEQQQLALVITPMGKTKLLRTIAAALPTQAQLEADAKAIGPGKTEEPDNDDNNDEDKNKSNDDAEPAENATALAGVGQMFGMFKELLVAADEQLTHLAVGVRIEDNSTLHVAARALFVPDGKLAAWAKEIKVPAEGLLAGVPPGKYIIAYGGVAASFSPTVQAMINRFSEAGMQTIGLDEENRKKYSEATEKLSAGKRLSNGVMGMIRPGDSLFETTISVEHVRNADEHLKNTREALAVMEASLVKNPESNKGIYTIRDVKVGELDAIEFETDYEALTQLEGKDQAAAAMMQGLLGKMFGRDGKVVMYVAKANDHVVISAYSKEQLVRGVEHIRSKAAGLDSDGDIAKTTALLPAGAQWVAYASPEGIVQLIGSFAQAMLGAEFKLPAFPASDPIGLAARVNETGLDAEIVLPENVVAGLGQFIGAVGQMFQGGQPLP